MLSYLPGRAAIERACSVAYTDSPTAVMTEDGAGGGRFTEIVLHPRVTISATSDPEVAERIHHDASRTCFIAASLNLPVQHEVHTVVASLTSWSHDCTDPSCRLRRRRTVGLASDPRIPADRCGVPVQVASTEARAGRGTGDRGVRPPTCRRAPTRRSAGPRTAWSSPCRTRATGLARPNAISNSPASITDALDGAGNTAPTGGRPSTSSSRSPSTRSDILGDRAVLACRDGLRARRTGQQRRPGCRDRPAGPGSGDLVPSRWTPRGPQRNRVHFDIHGAARRRPTPGSPPPSRPGRPAGRPTRRGRSGCSPTPKATRSASAPGKTASTDGLTRPPSGQLCASGAVIPHHSAHNLTSTMPRVAGADPRARRRTSRRIPSGRGGPATHARRVPSRRHRCR